MRRRPPRSTRTDTRVPYATLFRSELQSVFANVSVRPSEDGDGLVRVTITTSSPDIGIAFTESAFPKGFEQLSSMSKARGFDVFSGPFVKVFGADPASGMPEDRQSVG